MIVSIRRPFRAIGPLPSLKQRAQILSRKLDSFQEGTPSLANRASVPGLWGEPVQIEIWQYAATHNALLFANGKCTSRWEWEDMRHFDK